MFRRLSPPAVQARHRRRKLHAVPRDLSPRMMRDIGLEPWPEDPRIPPYPRF